MSHQDPTAYRGKLTIKLAIADGNSGRRARCAWRARKLNTLMGETRRKVSRNDVLCIGGSEIADAVWMYFQVPILDYFLLEVVNFYNK